MLPVVRSEAKLLSSSRYFTGRPCRRGHVTYRLTANGTCHACYLIILGDHQRRNCEKYRPIKSDWSKKNSERLNAKARENYRLNPGPKIRATKAWIEKNQERARVRTRNHRARKRAAEGIHTASDIDALFGKQAGLCLCGADLVLGYHVDHIIPLSRGGSNWPANLQLLCAPCNCSKGPRLMSEWVDRVAA